MAAAPHRARRRRDRQHRLQSLVPGHARHLPLSRRQARALGAAAGAGAAIRRQEDRGERDLAGLDRDAADAIAVAATPDPRRARAEVEAKQPVKRLGRPDEIAAIAALLASDEARFIIGANIIADGGVGIRMYE
jgi:NAD(P)-dependent dehydrogenase (short-subunit alcohol dehydrogenase family)